MNTVIAVPSSAPGGLEAPLGAHFCHCDMFTLVTVENAKIKEVQVVPNIPHEQGGCLAPVQYLADKGAKKIIAGGMGMRPLMGFAQVGIEVYHSNGHTTVGGAVKAMLKGELPQFSQNQTCGGGGGCNH